jgi:hypothetical protein
MQSDIFIKWFNYFNYYFCTINWKILLLINNADFHFNLKKFEKDDNNINNEEIINMIVSKNQVKKSKRKKCNKKK